MFCSSDAYARSLLWNPRPLRQLPHDLPSLSYSLVSDRGTEAGNVRNPFLQYNLKRNLTTTGHCAKCGLNRLWCLGQEADNTSVLRSLTTFGIGSQVSALRFTVWAHGPPNACNKGNAERGGASGPVSLSCCSPPILDDQRGCYPFQKRFQRGVRRRRAER